MLKKITLIIVLLLFFALVSLSICFYSINGLYFVGKSTLVYNVSFFDYGWFGKKETDSGGFCVGWQGVVTNFEDLKNLCNEWNNHAFNDNYEGNYNKLENCLRKYDNDFFNKKDLIIYSSEDWNYDYEPSIENLYIENSKIVILVSISNRPHIDLGEFSTIILETNKNDALTSLQIVSKNKIRH